MRNGNLLFMLIFLLVFVSCRRDSEDVEKILFQPEKPYLLTGDKIFIKLITVPQAGEDKIINYKNEDETVLKLLERDEKGFYVQGVNRGKGIITVGIDGIREYFQTEVRSGLDRIGFLNNREEVVEGQKVFLKLVINSERPVGEAVRYESEYPQYLAVKDYDNSGVYVEGLFEGEVKIKAKLEDKEAFCDVKILKQNYFISTDKNNVLVKKGSSDFVKAFLENGNEGDRQNFEFYNMTTDIILINKAMDQVGIIGLSPGSGVIRVSHPKAEGFYELKINVWTDEGLLVAGETNVVINVGQEKEILFNVVNGNVNWKDEFRFIQTEGFANVQISMVREVMTVKGLLLGTGRVRVTNYSSGNASVEILINVI